MAEKKEMAKLSEETTEAAVDTKASKTKYSVEELCENSVALFGKKREVIIGALHADNKSTSGSYTKKEVQDAIEKFLKKEVK